MLIRVLFYSGWYHKLWYWYRLVALLLIWTWLRWNRNFCFHFYQLRLFNTCFIYWFSSLIQVHVCLKMATAYCDDLAWRYRPPSVLRKQECQVLVSSGLHKYMVPSSVNMIPTFSSIFGLQLRGSHSLLSVLVVFVLDPFLASFFFYAHLSLFQFICVFLMTLVVFSFQTQKKRRQQNIRKYGEMLVLSMIVALYAWVIVDAWTAQFPFLSSGSVRNMFNNVLLNRSTIPFPVR